MMSILLGMDYRNKKGLLKAGENVDEYWLKLIPGRHNVMSVVRFKTHKSPCWEMLAVQLANIYPWHACSQSLFHLSVCQCKNGVTLK